MKNNIRKNFERNEANTILHEIEIEKIFINNRNDTPGKKEKERERERLQ